ncbi:MAG TPA: hypothetical protein VKU02_17710 [Gemmataceae bacterium]|nr:hypothetical protein [Gemmataceae bacterium]
MKIRIANILDKTAQTLLVAGVVGVPASLLAQTQPHWVVEKPSVESRSPEHALPGAPTPRVVEMKVALAWLADPVTTPWRLEARITGNMLEVHGQVPNERVLEHALHVAFSESGMQVVSKAELNATLRAPTLNRPQEVLHREAFESLRQKFPGHAPSITLRTQADGGIVLRGTIPTYEEKLAISRHLRETIACTSIRNELRVLTDPHDPFAPSTGHTVEINLPAAEQIRPEPIQPVSHTLASEPLMTGPTVTKPVEPSMTFFGARSGEWARIEEHKGLVAATGESLFSHSTGHVEATSAHPEAEKQPAAAAKPAVKPLVFQTKWRRMDPAEMAMPKKAPPPAPPKEPATPKPEPTADAHGPRTFLRVIPSAHEELIPASVSASPVKTETATVSKQSSPQGSDPAMGRSLEHASMMKNAESLAANASRTPASPLYPGPAPVRAPLPPALKVDKGEPYVSEGVMIVETAIKPASHADSATGQKPPAIVRTGPYVTTGVILFSDTATDAVRNSNPTLTSLQSHLQQSIAAACGKSNKDIEVTAASETNVAVRIRARSTLEGEALSNRIFQLPELGPYQVSLDVVVIK